MDMNSRLEELYSKNWNNLIKNGSEMKDIEPTNPLLLKVDETLMLKADLKVMIFGQETWEWHKFSKSIKDGMNGYESFFIKENYDKSSSFWKAFKFFKQNISNHFKNQNIVYIWNNISKIGRNDGKTGVTKDIRKLERDNFLVIKEELEIIQPDIVVFLTGDRDRDIEFNFSDAKFEDIEKENTKPTKRKYSSASKIISKSLPKKSVRLYHPAYFGGFNYIKNDALRFILS